MIGRPVVSASHEMSRLIEPPGCISETKSFETYKKDLARWAMLTTLDETKQALLVVHLLDGDPSGIKENLDEGVPDDDLKRRIRSLMDLKSILLSRGFEEVQF